MYLVYVDESGNPGGKNHFVLTALLIHESTWRKFDRLVNQIKIDLLSNEDPLGVELHTSPLVRKSGDFSGYSQDLVEKILIRMSNIVRKNRCRLISVIIDKEKIEPKGEETLRGWTQLWSWRLLLERIEKFLRSKNDGNRTNFGLLCIDNNSEKIVYDIREIIKKFREDGSLYLDSKYIVEDPFFVDSSMRNLIQLSDFIAWVTRQWYYEKKGTKTNYDEFNQVLFSNIEKRFDRSKTGDILGAGIKVHP